MIEVRPPSDLSVVQSPIVFLAGSIEMGTALEWQAEVVRMLRGVQGYVLNPRREAWDATWPQRMDFEPFREQVTWELDGLERADWVLFYFDPATRSPITLLELGLIARQGKAIVCCPEGYWRKGNVDIVCMRYAVEQCDTLQEAIQRIKTRVVRGENAVPDDLK